MRLLRRIGWLATSGVLCLSTWAGQTSSWTLARTQHFEVYSQSGSTTARSTLLWFEQLRAFFQETGLNTANRAPLRVIGFRSAQDYNPYRPRSSADAYYVGTGTRDYIVMPGLGASDFRLAAHEYAHSVLHAAALQLPRWLNEGLAEVFSTVRIGSQGCELGEPIAGHLQMLRRRRWIPLADLIEDEKSATPPGRDEVALFYAESWALTHMLMLAPEYRSEFDDLVAKITSGMQSSKAFTAAYRCNLEEIARDLHHWAENDRFARVVLPGIEFRNFATDIFEVSPYESRSLMAELVLANGDLDGAEARYRDLERESPQNADPHVALGTIALRKGDQRGAREEWKKAFDAGVENADLCYRYAVLAEDAAAPQNEIRAALERAVLLKPDFDDARYTLALLESNAGEYEAALANYRAMKTVAPARAFAYWSAVGYALAELGRRDEAKAAAEQAMKHASTPAERAQASQLSYISQTDLTVQFTRDAAGHLQLETKRVPHGTRDWNPFIEPDDDVRHAEGQLRNVDCGPDKITAIAVETPGGSLKLAIPDPLHVLVRNAPAEFMCGPQPGSRVAVEYAAFKQGTTPDGILRGLEFK